jgi:predicted nucleic acid-binding protein
MTARVFVDTNVFVYQLDTREPQKQAHTNAWLAHLWSARSGRVSFQVLAELYVTLTRKLTPGLDRESARKIVRSLWSWQPVPMEERLFASAWAVQDRFGLSWWDALVVAAAKLADCSLLLSEDLQHDQDLDGLRIINPFRVSPEEGI